MRRWNVPGTGEQQEQGHEAADEEMNDPEGPPVRPEGDHVQGGHGAGRIGLISDEKLHGLEDQESDEQDRTIRPSGATMSSVPAERCRPGR